MARASGGSVALSRLWPGRTDRLIIAPHDLRTADATRAAEIYAGRFVFAGKIVTCHGRSIFDLEPPSEDWEVALLGFGWLRHLRAADTALTRANARSLVDDWISNPGRKRPLDRRADVLARRVISLLSQAPLGARRHRRQILSALSARADPRDPLSALHHARHRRRRAAAAGPDRAVLRLAVPGQPGAPHPHRDARLSDELQRQILPDGGHISRNPGALVELLIDLLPLRQTFAARNIAPPPALLNAIDRMMPMLRFFRHGDGSFALFNGMSNAPSDLLATLLAYDDTHGVPMAHMPHTGFQRLDAGATTVIMDTGPPPPPSVSHDAHAGMPVVRTVIGPEPDRRSIAACPRPAATTGAPLRAARGAFDPDLSRNLVVPVRRAFGDEAAAAGLARRQRPGRRWKAIARWSPTAMLLTTSHDGYLPRFGVVHRRVLMIAHDGARLDGEDTLSPAPGSRIKGTETDYALRFHLHPAVKASRLSDARGVMLVLPNRDVWTFEALDDKVDLEDSVFLAGNDGPRRTAQIVIRQESKHASSIRWSFVRSTASASATTARRNARREPELPL